MTREPVKNYSDEYEWVEVKALQRFNINKRRWSGNRNIGLDKGEKYILPRGKTDGGFAEGMRFYYENDGFLEVVDPDPEQVSYKDSEDDSGLEASESNVRTPEPDIEYEENESKESDKDDLDMSYQQLRKWASNNDDVDVDGRSSKKELEDAYRDKELKTSEEDN